jgi:hypothetical protein
MWLTHTSESEILNPPDFVGFQKPVRVRHAVILEGTTAYSLPWR